MNLVLQHAQLLDGRIIDIVIENGQIVDITSAGQGTGAHIQDASGCLVSSGWIDLHVHAMAELNPYGDEIDEIGIKQGVTTIVDAGSCGADRIGSLFQKSQESVTKVYSFLNISHIGLERIDELSQIDWLDEGKVATALQHYRSFIVGLKARISKSVVKEMGVKPLEIARQWSNKYQLPLMVHIGSGPPEISEVLELLDANDIITHFLNGKSNNLFDEEGNPIPSLLEALNRGVYLDVGHGTASFSFDIAEKAKASGIHPYTISTDIYRNNRLNGPVFSMADTLTKFLYLGYQVDEVIEMVTLHAAERIGHPEQGCIHIGGPANLTLFELIDGEKVLIDSERQTRVAKQYIQAKGVVVNGTYYAC